MLMHTVDTGHYEICRLHLITDIRLSTGYLFTNDVWFSRENVIGHCPIQPNSPPLNVCDRNHFRSPYATANQVIFGGWTSSSCIYKSFRKIWTVGCFRPDFKFADHIHEELPHTSDEQPKKSILKRHRDCTSLEVSYDNWFCNFNASVSCGVPKNTPVSSSWLRMGCTLLN